MLGRVLSTSFLIWASSALAPPAIADPPHALFPGRLYDTGHAAFSIAVADFDHDGDTDCVIGTHVARVMWGAGPAGFSGSVDLTVPGLLDDVEAGDVDGDGNPDVAALRGDTLLTFLGDGLGGFSSPSTSLGSSWGEDLVLADLDNDGALDAVVATAGGLDLWMNDGQGSLSLSAVNAPSARSVVPADLDGDGDLDLAAAGSDLAVRSFCNDGTGGVTLAQTISVPASPVWVTASDVDGDGQLDVVASLVSPFGSFAQVLRGTGSCQLSPDPVMAIPGLTSRHQCGDLDGDGAIDLVTADGISTYVYVSLGKGDGSFDPVVPYTCGKSPTDLAIEDLDLDSRPDVLVGSLNGPNALCALWGDGAGGFDTITIPLDGFSVATERPNDIAVGDVNGDGRGDVVTVEYANFIGSHTLTVTPSLPSGDLGTPVHTPLNSSNPTCVALADLDADGFLDAVVGHGAIHVLFSDATGALGPPVGTFTGKNHTIARTGDVTGDGIDDVVFLNVFDSFTTLAGTGAETIGPLSHVDTGFSAWVLCADDFTGDGVADVVTGAGSLGGTGSKLYVHVNDGSGAFLPFIPIPGNDGLRDLRSADLDYDGSPELVSAYGNQYDAIEVRKSFGGGLFGPPSSYPAGLTPGRLALGDFDGDGAIDAATLQSPSLASIAVLRGDGASGFLAPESYAVGLDSVALAAGDVTGDCLPDLVVANHAAETVTFLPSFEDFQGALDAYGPGTAGSGGFVPALAGTGCPKAGASVGLALVDGVGGAAALMLIGTSGAAATPALGGTVLVAPPWLAIPLLTSGAVGAPGAGGFSLDAALPNDTPLFGLSVNLQVLIADPAAPSGVSMSNGVEVRIG